MCLSDHGRKHTDVTFPYTTKIKRGFDDTVVKAEAPSYGTETKERIGIQFRSACFVE